MKLQERVDAALKANGVLGLGGEMDVPINKGFRVAYDHAVMIAEACGYLVLCRGTRSFFEIHGGDMGGYYVLDWYSPDAKVVGKVEFWACVEHAHVTQTVEVVA